VNPTSNLLIGNLGDLTVHPLWRLRPPREGDGAPPVSVCIGSDDPVVFGSNLRQEYQILCDAMTLAGLSDEDLASIFADVPSVTAERSLLSGGLKLSQALVKAGACASKGEAVRLIQGGGVYLNNRKISADGPVTETELASKSMLVLRTGKKSYFLMRFE